MKGSGSPSRIGRKRRAAGWTLLVLGLLVAGVWVVSQWYAVRWANESSSQGIGGGVLWRESGDWGRHGWAFFRLEVSREREWWFGVGTQSFNAMGDVLTYHNYGLFQHTRMDDRHIGVSDSWEVLFWPIPLLLWASAALMFCPGIVARRRASMGACLKCGYSLAGLAVDAACPECGKGAGTK